MEALRVVEHAGLGSPDDAAEDVVRRPRAASIDRFREVGEEVEHHALRRSERVAIGVTSPCQDQRVAPPAKLVEIAGRDSEHVQ